MVAPVVTKTPPHPVTIKMPPAAAKAAAPKPPTSSITPVAPSAPKPAPVDLEAQATARAHAAQAAAPSPPAAVVASPTTTGKAGVTPAPSSVTPATPLSNIDIAPGLLPVTIATPPAAPNPALTHVQRFPITGTGDVHERIAALEVHVKALWTELQNAFAELRQEV